ncbi:MAG: hypothetical protein H6740_24735 [Alphaproteobacteria bacterium]|nr:hypothetical protein [Alphaproteobacteria bacterium]
MRALPLFIPALLLFACGEKDHEHSGHDDSATDDSGADDSGSDDSATDDSATDDSGSTEAFSCGEVPALPEPSVPAVRLVSTITWTLEFDEEAEANGYYDCAYSRAYEGVQEIGLEHLCPECEAITVGTATMFEGTECYDQVFTLEVERTEMWGITAEGGLHRTGAYQAAMAELTTFEGREGEEISLAWDSEYTLNSGGTMGLAATGSMSWTTDEDTLLVDTRGPRTEPYAAGWPQNNPGDLVATWPPALGETFPNARLMDQCGDLVDLWDFYGAYLILDSSQYDCGPCQAMAQGEHEFMEQMRAEGYDVHVLTYMGNGLSDPRGTPSQAIVDQWVDRFEIVEPVFYDRGYTYATFPSFIYDLTGEDFGFPAWLVIDPEMNVIHGNVGFGTWDAVADVIRADAEG